MGERSLRRFIEETARRLTGFYILIGLLLFAGLATLDGDPPQLGDDDL